MTDKVHCFYCASAGYIEEVETPHYPNGNIDEPVCETCFYADNDYCAGCNEVVKLDEPGFVSGSTSVYCQSCVEDIVYRYSTGQLLERQAVV